MKDVAATSTEFKLRVLAELKHVLETSFENASDRQRALLRYLVTEEIESRGARVKAYNIATEVFNRSANFDPQQDSIVRVEVGRLRQGLERHYLTIGAGAPLRIEIPKGQYRPTFVEASPDRAAATALAESSPLRRRGLLAAAILVLLVAIGAAVLLVDRRPVEPADSQKRPVVAVAPFSFTSDTKGQDYIAGGLHAEIASALSEFDWLTVVPLTEDATLGVDSDASRPWGADFVVRSSLRMVGDQISATVLLLDGKTRGVRWSKRYDFHLRAGEIDSVERDIVTKIAMDVGHPFGIISDIERARMNSADAGSEAAFDCKLHALQFWSARKRTDYPAARNCYEAMIDRVPRDADSVAALSLLLLDAAVEKFDATSKDDLLARAQSLAGRAYDLDKTRFLPRVAKYTSALCLGDGAVFQSVGRALVDAYPNNPLALADFGLKLVLGSVDPGGGLALLQKARSLSNNLLPSSVTAPAIEALRRGEAPDLAVLRDAAFKSDAAWVLLSYLAGAVARRDAKETARAMSRLADAGFKTPDEIRAALNAQCWSKETRDVVAKYVEEELKASR